MDSKAMTKTPEEIAAGLSERERRALRNSARCQINCSEQFLSGTSKSLIEQGLFQHIDYDLTTTLLGQSVRTIIEKEQDQ